MQKLNGRFLFVYTLHLEHTSLGIYKNLQIKTDTTIAEKQTR